MLTSNCYIFRFTQMAVKNEIYLNISYDKSSPVTKGQFGTIFHGKWNWTVGIGKLNNVQVANERIEKNWFSIDISFSAEVWSSLEKIDETITSKVKLMLLRVIFCSCY